MQHSTRLPSWRGEGRGRKGKGRDGRKEEERGEKRRRGEGRIPSKILATALLIR